LLAHFSLDLLAVVQDTEADGGATRKYLLELTDGQRIETVLMHCRGRVTACLSSQAGCGLGCVFCATGQMGFGRNLTTGEIVAQAVHAAGVALRTSGQPLRNVVLMGMGEPLLNYDAVMRAIDILSDGGGLAIAGKRTTLSTVGVIPGIIRLADERRSCSLAVSLHAATQEERARLVPSAAAWPLDELMSACRYYVGKSARRIFFEWTLIAGRSDSAEQARALADLVQDIRCQINLIPLNPTAGFAGAAGSEESLPAFVAVLRRRGLPVTIRRGRGTGIAAGCGQLATNDALALS
jgi:23S rRNA (adenine2503-C2)-methyltransferase